MQILNPIRLKVIALIIFSLPVESILKLTSGAETDETDKRICSSGTGIEI